MCNCLVSLFSLLFLPLLDYTGARVFVNVNSASHEEAQKSNMSQRLLILPLATTHDLTGIEIKMVPHFPPPFISVLYPPISLDHRGGEAKRKAFLPLCRKSR